MLPTILCNLIVILLTADCVLSFKCTCIKNGERAACENKLMQKSTQGRTFANMNALDDELLTNAVPFEGLKYIHMQCDIQNLQLKSFKNQENLNTLDLSWNLLSKLPANLFHFTPQLTILNLSQNKFKSVDTDTFFGLKKLRSLDLSHNLLTKLDMGVLDDMILLERLLLNDNNLKTLPSGVLNELSHLQKLDLSKNQLTNIDFSLFESTTKLEEVNLSENKLDKRNALEGLANLESVVNLDLSHCAIQTLRPQLFKKLKNLKKINLNSNPLRLLPHTFDSADSLTTIYMSKCGLTSIPPYLFDHNLELEELDLSYNHLSTLHEALLNKTLNFKYLNISHNDFSDLSLKLFQWTSLTEIDLSFNKFQTILPELLNMETMESIHAQHNEITYLQDDAFSSCTFPIVYIDLRYNRLVYLQELLFDWVANLEELRIFGNPWDCSCLENLIKLLSNRFIQYDEEDFQKSSAICVAGEPHVCPYYTTNLTYYYDVFKKVL